jgi:hypothetical protein
VQVAVWNAIRPIISETVALHVRALVDGASVLPQPRFEPPSAGAAAPAPEPAAAAAQVNPEPAPRAAGAGAAPEAPAGTKKYRMGRGSKHSYDEIAYNEIPEDEFDLYEAWPRYLEPLVEYASDRAAENFRRAIRQNTARFDVSPDLRRARKKKPGEAPRRRSGTRSEPKAW